MGTSRPPSTLPGHHVLGRRHPGGKPPTRSRRCAPTSSPSGEVCGGHRSAGLGGSGEHRFGGAAGARVLVAELVKQRHC